MREASKNSKELLKTMASVTSKIVEWIINLAPFGILGLVFETISDQGIASLANYGILLGLLIATMVFVALVINPLIAFLLYKEKSLSTCLEMFAYQRESQPFSLEAQLLISLLI